jgi:TPR repeat protein
MKNNILKIIILLSFTLIFVSCSNYEAGLKNIAENFYQEHKNENTLLPLEKAADSGDTSAMLKLGKIYYTGTRNVRHNSDKSDFWYNKAAKHGGYKTNIEIANMYLKGINAKKNYYKAIEYADTADFFYDQQKDGINDSARIKAEAEKLLNKKSAHQAPKANSQRLRTIH